MSDRITLTTLVVIPAVLVLTAVGIVFLFPYSKHVRRSLNFSLAVTWWRYLTESGLTETNTAFIATNALLYFFAMARGAPSFTPCPSREICRIFAEGLLKITALLRIVLFLDGATDNNAILLIIVLLCFMFVIFKENVKEAEMYN